MENLFIDNICNIDSFTIKQIYNNFSKYFYTYTEENIEGEIEEEIEEDIEESEDVILSNKKNTLKRYINNIDNSKNYIISNINDNGVIEGKYTITTNNNLVITGTLKNGLSISNAQDVNITGKHFIFNGDLFNNQLKIGIFRTDKIIYSGTFSQNLFSGNGNLKFIHNNNFYSGNFENGKFQGRGISYCNNILYHGNFNDGLYSGSGILLNDNNLYYGDFSQGLKNNIGYELELPNELLLLYYDDNRISFITQIYKNINSIVNDYNNKSYLTVYDKGVLLSKKLKLETDLNNTLTELEQLKISYQNILNEKNNCELQLQDIQNNPKLLCNICVTNCVNTILYPCNHIIMCSNCCLNTFIPQPRYNNSILNNNTNNNNVKLTSHIRNKCPVCRIHTKSYSEVYIT
jgi:hypothetical protein